MYSDHHWLTIHTFYLHFTSHDAVSERFLNALFFLRQQIRHLAIKRELVVSYQMVTLSDVVIAAIIDHVSCHGSSGESKRTLEDGTKYSTIELVVRLPQRMDSLANFLATPILSVKPDLNLKIKLGALAILYCSRCLSPVRESTDKNLADCLSNFWLGAQLDKLPDVSITHLLCVYMVRRAFSSSSSV
jgi:hypothetical protein